MSQLSDRVLLRELLIQLACEVLMERGVGSSFVAAEKAAKEELDAAEAAVQEWERENEKKAAFMSWAMANKVKPDSAAAQKEKKANPGKYSWDPKIVQKAEKTLRADVDKARKQYIRFNPLTADLPPESMPKRVRSAGPEGKAPDPKKKSYAKLSDIKDLQFNSWNDPRWARAIKDVQVGFKKTSGGDNAGHPGEDRLAVIFGAERQGDTVSFDLLDKEGMRWEVKGLEQASSKIRPGIMGATVFAKAASNILAVCRQMQKFVREIKEIGVDTVCTTDQQKKMVLIIERTMANELPQVASKEISVERLEKVLLALRATAYLKTAWEKEIDQQMGDKVKLADKDIDVDRRSYIDIARRLSGKPGSEGLLEAIDARERCLYRLYDKEAFDSPVDWMDNWAASVDVRKVFADVDGVIIVRPEGFFKVSRKNFTKVFIFKGSSQDVPRFGFEPEGEAADKKPEASAPAKKSAAA